MYYIYTYVLYMQPYIHMCKYLQVYTIYIYRLNIYIYTMLLIDHIYLYDFICIFELRYIKHIHK